MKTEMKKIYEQLKGLLGSNQMSSRQKRINPPTTTWQKNPGWDPDYIKLFGKPKTVIDVGVADGTPELYAAFPSAYHVLIDPLPAHEEAMKGHLESYRDE